MRPILTQMLSRDGGSATASGDVGRGFREIEIGWNLATSSGRYIAFMEAAKEYVRVGSPPPA